MCNFDEQNATEVLKKQEQTRKNEGMEKEGRKSFLRERKNMRKSGSDAKVSVAFGAQKGYDNDV